MPKAPLATRLGIVAASAFLFLLACGLPALEFTNGRVMRGFELLIMGWAGLQHGQPAWLANPILWLSWLFTLLSWELPGGILATLGLLVGSVTLRLYADPLPAADQAGVTMLHLQQVKMGFNLWMTSLLAVVMGSFVLRLQRLKLAGDG